MNKIGLFYSFNSIKTKQQAKLIIKEIGTDNIDEIDIEQATESIFNDYNNYILAIPTWFDGELPNYWDEFIPSIEDNSLKGKTFALYGGGDQKGYPENFVDGIGIVANFIKKREGKIIGFTSTEGYEYEASKAKQGKQFVGLALDVENQYELTNKRIKKWCNQLKKEFSNS